MRDSGYEFQAMPKKDCFWFLKNVWALRTLVITVIAFVVPIPVLLDGSVEFRCAYVVIVMAILWLTEAIPIPATALLPIFLFPMLGVVTARTVCSKYVNDTTMLFFGGLILAVAVEEVNLHKRIAIGIIKLIGTQPNMLMLGLMLPTWFLSMWISNTATTSMMLPILLAVTEQVTNIKSSDAKPGDDGTFYMPEIDKENGQVKSQHRDSTEVTITEVNEDRMPENKVKVSRMSKGFTLCVAYAASIGGVATLTGTPPNLILQGQANTIYSARKAGADSGISFAKWMGFALPMSIIVLFFAWIWLQIVFIGFRHCRKTDVVKRQAMKIVVDKEYKKLGPVTFGEIMVLILFILLAILWLFRDIPDVGGWRYLFREDSKGNAFTRDSTASMLIAVLLFFLPVKRPSVFCWNQFTDDGELVKPKYTPILDWQTAGRKVQWGVIILLGGGFALACASSESGLSKWVGHRLEVFSNFEPWIMNLVLSCIVAAATEVTSNSATATLLMPIMANLAINIGAHPLYLMISAAVSCSFAFMLPVATPPNAIVFASGFIRIPDMALTGIVMNIIALLCLAIAINTWASPIFSFDTIPEIFLTNVSSTTVISSI